jgi:hypothetical protein
VKTVPEPEAKAPRERAAYSYRKSEGTKKRERETTHTFGFPAEDVIERAPSTVAPEPRGSSYIPSAIDRAEEYRRETAYHRIRAAHRSNTRTGLYTIHTGSIGRGRREQSRGRKISAGRDGKSQRREGKGGARISRRR